VEDRRLAGSRGAAAPTRPDGARDPTGVRLSPFLARRRPRDLGQPRHDASRAAVRRCEASPRAPSCDDPRYRAARARPHSWQLARFATGRAGPRVRVHLGPTLTSLGLITRGTAWAQHIILRLEAPQSTPVPPYLTWDPRVGAK